MDNIDPERLLTSSEVGALLQVNPSSVKNWVNDGRIAAFRTPGGHRRIKASDLVAFLDLHKMPIPQRLSAASRRRLLVVDDDAPYLRALGRQLKRHAGVLDSELVSNGIDALLRVGSFKPHLVLLDIFMPELDGLEVCRRLKANADTANISVIFASGQVNPTIERNALAAGAACCLRKPVSVDALLTQLGLGAAMLHR
jgi:excisionase family DNA binding protein